MSLMNPIFLQALNDFVPRHLVFLWLFPKSSLINLTDLLTLLKSFQSLLSESILTLGLHFSCRIKRAFRPFEDFQLELFQT